MIPCFDVPVVVDRVEEGVAVVEVGGVTVGVPALDGMSEGAVLWLCAVPAAVAAAPSFAVAPPTGAAPFSTSSLSQPVSGR